MRLDLLQLDLRPRTNAQALDLGFALLRANATRVYLVWLSLWIPLVLLSFGISYLLFGQSQDGLTYGFVLAWWLRPWLERAPLYMLSRQVFGEQVGYLETLKAWPKQLGGGFLRLFVLRPFAAGRGLYQAIWQLEGARKSTARYRIRVIGRKTSGSATWFGVACAYFETIIQIGLYAIVGLFLSDQDAANPFALFTKAGDDGMQMILICYVISYAIATSLIGPIYIACCFTLYLNRRATLEAWDLEIALRQMTQKIPTTTDNRNTVSKALLGVIGAIFFVTSMGLQDQAQAAVESKHASSPSCDQEQLQYEREVKRFEAVDATTEKTRQQVDKIYQGPDFQLFECQKKWAPKEPKEDESKDDAERIEISERMKLIAQILKYVFIALGLTFFIWLLLRYRGQFFGFERPSLQASATEVAGLDIRPESLPDDVASSAQQLWDQGQRRAAIALLYRASLARLVERHGLHINKGATEQDCLRLSEQLIHTQETEADLQQCFASCTEVWLKAAYAHVFPNSINSLCQQWRQHFDQGATI